MGDSSGEVKKAEGDGAPLHVHSDTRGYDGQVQWDGGAFAKHILHKENLVCTTVQWKQ